MGIKPLRNYMQKWKFSKVCSSRCLNIYWLSQDLWTLRAFTVILRCNKQTKQKIKLCLYDLYKNLLKLLFNKHYGRVYVSVAFLFMKEQQQGNQTEEGCGLQKPQQNTTGGTEGHAHCSPLLCTACPFGSPQAVWHTKVTWGFNTHPVHTHGVSYQSWGYLEAALAQKQHLRADLKWMQVLSCHLVPWPSAASDPREECSFRLQII